MSTALSPASEVDALTRDAAAEAFAVVDLLEANPRVRRSLSDPGFPAQHRVSLAESLLSGRLSSETMHLVRSVVTAPHESSRALSEALESAAVAGLLRGAHEQGQLSTVQAELNAFKATLDDSRELSDALADRRAPLEAKRQLVSRLTKAKVSDTSHLLLLRALAARQRTMALTVQHYLEVAAQIGGYLIAKVRVAQPLEASQRERLETALERKYDQPVSLQIDIDPSVLGGIDVAVGDQLISSTVAGRLEQARRHLTNS